MAEEKKSEEKVEKKEEGDVAGFDFTPYILWTVGGLIFFYVAYAVIFQTIEGMLNFVLFLNILQLICAILIIFFLFKLSGYILEYKHWTHKMEMWYVGKYKPEEEKSESISPERERYGRAKLHIESQYKEEWKIGVIELDNLLRDLLKAKGYNGETVADLLDDATKKGMRSVNSAWEGHRVRNRVVHEGLKYDFPKEEALKILRKYTEAFSELGL